MTKFLSRELRQANEFPVPKIPIDVDENSVSQAGIFGAIKKLCIWIIDVSCLNGTLIMNRLFGG